MDAAVRQLRKAVTNAVAITVAWNGLELHKGGVSVLFLLSVAPLIGPVGSRGGTQWVPPSVAYLQAKAYVDQDHGKNHTQASEDSDQRQVDCLQVPRGEKLWVGEERGGGWCKGSFRNRRLCGCLQSGKKASRVFIRLNGCGEGGVRVDEDLVGNYGHLDVVLNSVAGVQATLLLLRLNDQKAVGARSIARAEAVALQLAAVQGPEGIGQVGSELALQQQIITHSYHPVPHGNVWNTQNRAVRKTTSTLRQSDCLSLIVIEEVTGNGKNETARQGFWNCKTGGDICLPWISKRLLSGDGKMWLEKGGEDFAKAARIINFQRSLRAGWWQVSVFQLLPNNLFSILLSSFTGWKGNFLFSRCRRQGFFIPFCVFTHPLFPSWTSWIKVDLEKGVDT